LPESRSSGGRDELWGSSNVAVVVCTGRQGYYVSQIRIVGDLQFPQERHATMIHPTAVVSDLSVIGPGGVLSHRESQYNEEHI
jgi:hypothetical protein